jgi:hypothetical protein
MPAVTLQIALPDAPTLSRERLEEITGRTRTPSIMAWLDEHHWLYQLDASGNLVVGSLYAHLRLAGLDPAEVSLPDIPDGFDLGKVR